jgi:hypothetical protein
MHISKIYIQENFIPNVNIDQFRRKVFGMEITIKEGEDVGQAISEAETHIANYIKINTVPMDDECRGVKVRDISPEESRLSATQSIINDINTCKEVKVLESYRLIAKSNPEIQTAYDNKLKLLNNGL